MLVVNIDGREERNDGKTGEKRRARGGEEKGGKMRAGELARKKGNVINLTANNKLS